MTEDKKSAKEKTVETTIVARKHHDVIVATPLVGAMWDRMKIREIQDKLGKYLDAKKPPALVLDLEHIDKISSEAISAMLKVRDHAVANGIEFRLCNLQDAVREVLQITALTELFDIYDTLQDAYQDLVPDDA